MSFAGDIKRAKISVLRAKGLNDKEIAKELDIDPATVSYHRKQIRKEPENLEGFIQKLLTKL